MTQTKNLEDKRFYRFVKVMYVFFLAILSILFVINFYDPPRKVIDNNKSYFVCPNGTKHTYESLNIYFYSSTPFYYDSDVKKALVECNKNLKKGDKITDNAAIKWINSNKHWESSFGNPYPTHWVYKTKSSWLHVFLTIFIGLTIIFLIMNIFKQSIIYIVYGKKINIDF